MKSSSILKSSHLHLFAFFLPTAFFPFDLGTSNSSKSGSQSSSSSGVSQSISHFYVIIVIVVIPVFLGSRFLFRRSLCICIIVIIQILIIVVSLFGFSCFFCCSNYLCLQMLFAVFIFVLSDIRTIIEKRVITVKFQRVF